MPNRSAAVVVGGAILLAGCARAASEATPPSAGGPPYRPEDALATLQVADGFRVELVAAEPLVSDPVAMEIDEAGRMYVVEMHGYPLDTRGSGRIVLLDDTDGDGRADRSSVFAEGLRLPNGIMRWKEGVLVTDSPDLLYLEDSDGDGKADVRRVVLTGFALSNPQHNTNSPIYGLDNWIYLANEGTVGTSRYRDLFGDEGSPVRFADAAAGPTLPPNADGRNVRLRPDSRELEMLSSRSQFGQAFDRWGRHFFVTNNRPIYHEVVAARYLSRNPALLVSSVVQHLPDYGSAPEVYPITENPEHQMLTDVGIMTSAAGLVWYDGDLFPPGWGDVALVTESAHNLVHAMRVRPDGVSFRAGRVEGEREFLASTDSWFRPVNLYVGPDGALYVLDYYRKVIEHPEWLDDSTTDGGELYSGADRGRIYRVVPAGGPRRPAPRPDLHTATARDLVRALEHPNGWWRRHAQRLLVERRAEEAVPLLVRMASESASAAGRVHALWALEGMGRLDASLIAEALADDSAGVRENALRLAELHLPRSPFLAERLPELREDDDRRVRFQLLLTLGDLHTPAAEAARRQLLMEGIEDEWMQIAALSAARVDPGGLYAVATEELGTMETPARRSFFQRVAAMIGALGDAEGVRRVVQTSLAGDGRAAWWRSASLEGVAGGLRREVARSAALESERQLLLDAVLEQDSAGVRRSALRLLEALGLPAAPLEETLRGASGTARNRTADPDLRADALRLLALRGPAPYAVLFRESAAAGEPAAVQIAAVRALGQLPGDSVAAFLFQHWEQWTPAVRDEAVRALARDRGRLRLLVDAVEAGVVQPSEIDRQTRIGLIMASEEGLRRRARALFTTPAAATEAVMRYRESLDLTGDPEAGRRVFARSCAACHQYQGSGGIAFGPDLAQVRHRPRLALLTDILDPGRALADGYELWTIERSDGSTVVGIIAEETPALLTLRQLGGGETAVPRAGIVSMAASPASAMPEGLEAQISPQEMADLLTYLRGGR